MMQKSKYFLILLFSIVCCFSAHLLADTPLYQHNLDIDREIFSQAESAFKKNDIKNYEKLSKQLVLYPLYPYLEYEELKARLQKEKPKQALFNDIQAFDSTYPDFPFSHTLKITFLKQAAKHKNWAIFNQCYYKNNDPMLICIHADQGNTASLETTKKLWLSGKTLPDPCEILFKKQLHDKILPSLFLWERLLQAFEQKNAALVKILLPLFPANERAFAQQGEKLLEKPRILLQSDFEASLTIPEPQRSQFIFLAVKRLIRTDAESALSWWKKNPHYFSFSPKQKAEIEGDIGVFLAHQKSPLAPEWLAELPDASLDAVAQEWRIRLALRAGDWAGALFWIDKLPTAAKQEPCWTYWRARALEALKRPGAKEIYQHLAKTRSYYGFLASLRQSQPIRLAHHSLTLDPAVTQRVVQLPALKRFLQLLLLGKYGPARVEWFRALDKMDETEIIACAMLAYKMDLFDIAILTVAKTRYKDDLQLRFPLAFQEEIIKNTRQNDLDPAWVFALIRQESAFHQDAVSPVGARGLMQLMPSSAQMLAENNHLDFPTMTLLHQPAYNIKVGTIYLKNLKERMQNNLLLATASYNAGPRNIARWREAGEQEADLWIESVPFKETREYLKNIVTYTGIYRAHLGDFKGDPSGIATLLQPIPAKVD